MRELPPGPRAPAAVNLAQFAVRPLESLFRWRRRYGDVFAIRFPVFGTGVYVADPAAIKELFTGEQSDLLAGEANSFMAPVLGERSALVLDGPEHLRQRKLLLAPFQGPRVAGFREVIRQVAEREVAGWRAGQPLVLRDRMRGIAFEVICRVVFGVTEPLRVERLRRALVAVIDSSPLYMLNDHLRVDYGRWSPGRRFEQRLAAADRLLLDEIARRRREADLEERTDVLSLLLRAVDDAGMPMTDRELRDELFTMLAAGHETTATQLAFAFELLLRNPAVLARLRESLSEGDVYLDAVVKETMRLRPVIDAAERTLTRPRSVAGWELPAGVKVYPGIVLVHHRADLYPEPTAFRPERFLDPRTESYTWLPFGGGIRRCLGAALAHAEIAEVLRVAIPAAELTPVRPKPDPVVLRGITLAPYYGVKVEVARVLGAQTAAAAGASRAPAPEGSSVRSAESAAL